MLYPGQGNVNGLIGLLTWQMYIPNRILRFDQNKSAFCFWPKTNIGLKYNPFVFAVLWLLFTQMLFSNLHYYTSQFPCTALYHNPVCPLMSKPQKALIRKLQNMCQQLHPTDAATPAKSLHGLHLHFASVFLYIVSTSCRKNNSFEFSCSLCLFAYSFYILDQGDLSLLLNP